MSSYAIPPEVSDNFTQDEIQEYVSQFKEIDEDGNGTLDKNEMTELIKHFRHRAFDSPKCAKAPPRRSRDTPTGLQNR